MKFKIIILSLLMTTCFSFVTAVNKPVINSNAAVAMDADSSIVLYNKGMNKKIYPASTTKILTAILAIENLNLDKSVVVSKTAINIPWDSSSVYLKEGEIISVNDLLYCLLLNSGNDAANVLAEAVSKDIKTFVNLMNEKVKEIGCSNTHFNNAHGYSDDNHYTTALDMAKIFRYCIQNETFVKIISTKSYIVAKTNKTNSERYLNNTNRLILKKEDSIYSRYYEYCIGGKTGFTNEAGRTLVTFAKKGDETIIVAVFGASSSGTQDVRYTDAINLFNYSFNNFNKKTIAEAKNYSFNYINTDKKLNYSVGLKEDLAILSSNSDNQDLSYVINIDETNLKGMTEDTFKEVTVGTIIFTFQDDEGNTYEAVQDLYLTGLQKYTAISHANVLMIITTVIISLIVFALVVIIIKNKNKIVVSKKSRKNRRMTK